MSHRPLKQLHQGNRHCHLLGTAPLPTLPQTAKFGEPIGRTTCIILVKEYGRWERV